MHAHMALGPNRWLGGEEHKPISNEHTTFLNSQQRNPKKVSILTQTDPVNRLPDTDQSNSYNRTCLNSDSRLKNDPTMFDPNPNLQPTAQPPNASVYSHVEKKECDKNNVVNEFPFCYNMNVLQKVQQPPPPGPQDQQQQQQQQQTATGAAPTNVVGMDDKGCYRFDIPQPPFTYNYALVNQMSLAAAASTATFKCEVCGAHFSHISMLNNHKRVHAANNVVQTTERPFSCDTCGACFNDNADLKAHKTSVHKVRFCATCSTEINCEQIKNKKAKYVRCENCLANSSATTNFVSGGTQSSPVTTDAQNSTENNNLSSQQQNNLSSQQQQNNNTTTTTTTTTIKEGHHPVKRRNLATIAKCHKCNGSGVIFIGVPRNLDKPFQCNICEGRFSRYSSLWSHKRLHTGDKPFKCQACGLTFAKAAYLKNHHRVHTGEKPFKCDVCGMQFSQSPHLKNHERIHSGERPYQCEVCEKSFARHSTLWNHKRIHTGEKPYRCDICGSAFNQATHLKNHGKVHTGEKPHRCDICEVGFSDRFALKRHRNIHEKYARQQQAQQQQAQQQQAQQQVPNQQTQQQQTASASQVPPQPPPSQQQAPPPQQQQHHQAQTQPQQTGGAPIEEVYKYEVSGPIAFPGCSRPPEQK